MSRAVVSAAVAVFALTSVPAAAADGLPVPTDGLGTTTVVRPDGEGVRYATVDAGERTELLRIDQNGGEVTGTRRIDGDFTVPLVAIDGTPSGLSADGATLALISPRSGFRFPRRETSFVIVDVDPSGAMRPREPLTLRGDFSFDALSPDGRALYLVEYTTADYNDYVVREYDLERERLVREPVLVPDEPPGEMRGLPMTRATTPDGRWAYTLYNGGGGKGEAFIHGLDTVESKSVCIDLPMLSGRDASRADLVLADDGRTLDVTGFVPARGTTGTLATVDTETFAVTEPLAAPEPEAAVDRSGDGPSGLAIGAIAAGIVVLIGTAVGLRRRRHDAALPPDPFPPGATPDRDRVST